ncbi:MAG: glycosyltransferase N-terminal domain-containing protein [Hyphomonadaceae bacterium]|nr:glycosyltransferase N-terminal domain-containing protein [Hyphomonadaceae bacterium]
MTASLALYQIGTRLLEPLAPWLVEQRIKSGKERPERIRERFGFAGKNRPDAPLLWLHGASVGESRLLIDVFSALRKRRPDVHALVTTQTLTSADMIAAWSPPNLLHQMAPVDGPNAVERFQQHWKPDAAVFCEGEIWPNMLTALKAHGVPAALINARMTEKTLRSWQGRQSSARQVFSTFGFIGAADQATADGIFAATGRRIKTVGNLKSAAAVDGPSSSDVEAWRKATGGRPILLAASTHPGEDEVALNAFIEVRMRALGALLIVVPRHPDRGEAIGELMRGRGLTTQQRSKDKSLPGTDVDVLVADTIGELLFWYAASDGVYLGGATAEGIGGHNPVEPAQLGKRVFTGPYGFNFRETFEALEKAGAITIGRTHQELAAYWLAALDSAMPGPVLGSFFSVARQPFETTLDAIVAMLPPNEGKKGGADA